MSEMVASTEISNIAPASSPSSSSAIKSAMDITSVLSTEDVPTSPIADDVMAGGPVLGELESPHLTVAGAAVTPLLADSKVSTTASNVLNGCPVREDPRESGNICVDADRTADVEMHSAPALPSDADVKVGTKTRSRRTRKSENDEISGDPNNREFVCMNDEYSQCMTGQYTMNLARKVISNHFGRNKACTRAIKSWPLFCRKHYQRATYKPDLWQRRKVDLIARQLGIIEEARPGTTYKISLKKSEENRLNTFARLADQGLTHAQASAAVQVDDGNKAFQAPINVLREIADYLGEGKSMDVAMTLVTLILEMLKTGETPQVPSIEFLPEITDDLEVKPVKTSASSSSASRVKASGAIQKPRKK